MLYMQLEKKIYSTTNMSNMRLLSNPARGGTSVLYLPSSNGVSWWCSWLSASLPRTGWLTASDAWSTSWKKRGGISKQKLFHFFLIPPHPFFSLWVTWVGKQTEGGMLQITFTSDHCLYVWRLRLTVNWIESGRIMYSPSLCWSQPVSVSLPLWVWSSYLCICERHDWILPLVCSLGFYRFIFCLWSFSTVLTFLFKSTVFSLTHSLTYETISHQ